MYGWQVRPCFVRSLARVTHISPCPQSLRKLRNVDEYWHAKFFISILNLLLKIMVDKSDTAKKEAFSDMLAVITSVGNKLDGGGSDRHSLLSSYVTFSFTNPVGERPLFAELVNYWLRECKKQSMDTERSFKYSWFLYELIIKSMAMHLAERGLLSMSCSLSLSRSLSLSLSLSIHH